MQIQKIPVINFLYFNNNKNNSIDIQFLTSSFASFFFVYDSKLMFSFSFSHQKQQFYIATLDSSINSFIDIHTTVLIEGVLFRARYLGSTQLVCEGQPTKSTRMMQAEEAVSRIKVSVKFTHNREIKIFIPSTFLSLDTSNLSLSFPFQFMLALSLT